MHEHIFQNGFYNRQPLPLWSYEVFFQFDLTEDQNAADRSELLNHAVQSITIPGLRVETMDIYFPGFKKGYQAKPTMNGQLQVKFNDNSSLAVRDCLEEIFQKTFNADIGLSYDDYADKNFSFSILVKLINPENDDVVGVCKYYGCFIQAISDLDFDYKGEEAIDVTATINYKYFKMVPWNNEE